LRLNRLVFAVLLFAGHALASDWLKITTPNFEMYTTAGERKGRAAILYFEQVRDLFLRILPGTLHNPLPVRIVAFHNDKEYEPFRATEFAVAYYLGSDSRDYVVMSSIDSDDYPATIHEYIHLLINHAGLKVPPWLNEGLADVYSTLEPDRGKILIGNPMPGRLRVLGQEKWIDLERLTGVTQTSPEYNESKRAGMFYAESWLLTHMLYLGDKYQPKFNVFFQNLLETNSAEQSFQKAYGVSLREVERDLRQYMRGANVNLGVFQAKLQKPSELPVGQPATRFESDIVLADLFTLLRKRDQAGQIYDRLAKEDPNRWELQSAIAYLAWRNGERLAARDHFARAAELGSTDGQMYFDYAKLLQGDSSKDQPLEDALGKALQLRPDLTKARVLLGLHYYNVQRYGLAVATMNQVKHLTPDQAPSVFLAMAYSQLKLGNRPEAKTNAEKAKQFAKSAEQIDAADQVLKFLKGSQDSETQP